MKPSTFLSCFSSLSVASPFFFAALAASPSSNAAPSRTEGALVTALHGKTLRATLKDGFHFNEKAPNTVTVAGTRLKPSKLTPREAEFDGLPDGWKSARAALFICDDAVTFCEPRVVEIGASGKATTAALAAAPAKRQINGPIAIDEYGFILNNLDAALARAKKSKQLVLADFSARWCPGCIRFETETFPKKMFKTASQGLIKVKIDVDRFENIVLSEKFKISAIPSLIAMTHDQEEIDRLVDYQSDEVVIRFFAAVKEDATPIAKLISTDSSDPKVNLRIGRRLLATDRYEDAIRFLSRVAPTPPELLTAKVAFAVRGIEKDLGTLRTAIQTESGSVRSIAWREQLVQALVDKIAHKAEVEKLVAAGTTLADSLMKDDAAMKLAIAAEPIGEFSGYEKLWVASLKADLIEAGKPAGEVAKAARLAAAKVGLDLKIPLSATGPSLRLLLTLIQAEDFAAAFDLSSALLKKDANNPELQRRHLRVLLGLKKYDDAITIGEKALKDSYDRNEYFVADALSKAYIGAGKVAQARAILDRYLDRPESAWSNIKSTREAMLERRKTL